MQPKPNLDLLRAIAVALVLLDHCTMSKGITRAGPVFLPSLGVFGVFLFFIHTSLVLMWSLERRPNVLDFYVRRAFRIYPLAILTILIAAATHAPVSGGGSDFFQAATVTAKSLIANCLLITDLIPNGTLVHEVTWSLAPEMHMYLLLPALFFYARSQKKIWPLLVGWIFAAVYAFRLQAQVGYGNWFYILIPDFIAGVIAYAGFLRKRPVLPAGLLFALIALFAVIYASVHGARVDWVACLVLGLTLPYFRQFRSRWLQKAAHTIATYSYGIYLIHPFSLVLAVHLLPHQALWLQLGVFLGTLAVGAFLSYHLVERPMIDMGARLAARWAHERGLPSAKDLESLEPSP